MSSNCSIYSPLPQSNSESDEFSEEELPISIQRQHMISQLSKFQNQITSEITVSVKKPKVTNYKQLDNDIDIVSTLNGYPTGGGEATMIQNNHKMDKMSTKRKICFIFSIFLCIFTTVVFLWIFPCDIGSCPASTFSVDYWKQDLFEIELYGPISLVPNIEGGQNLIFLYRKSLFEKNNTCKMSLNDEGIISLLGRYGKKSWEMVLNRKPKELGCSVMDINNDNQADCIVVGANNLLKAIDSQHGSLLWDVLGDDGFNEKQCDFVFPIVLPDIDKDNVQDLVTVCSYIHPVKKNNLSSQSNLFVLISGKTGKIIGKPMEILHCSYIRNFMLDEKFLMYYTCLDLNNKESFRNITFSDILRKMKLTYLIREPWNLKPPRNKIEPERRVFNLLGRRLTVENKGRCPLDCHMTVTVKNKRNETLWEENRNGSYGMVPVTLNFGKLNGFVFKYWQWNPSPQKIPLSDHMNYSNFENDKIKNDIPVNHHSAHKLKEPKYLQLNLFKDDLKDMRHNRIKRYKRMFSNGLLRNKRTREADIIFHTAVERIVVITFNEVDLFVVNASQFEFTQICKESFICQPDATLQKQSLLIADLDGDDFQELISYSTTHQCLNQNTNVNETEWTLQSTIHVIRLEAELPKLYDFKLK